MATGVPFRVRRDVFERCGWACFYCGQSAYDDPEGGAVGLCIDHLMPQALDGSNAALNLVAACLTCNNLKAAREPHPVAVMLVATQHRLWEAQCKPLSMRALPLLTDGIIYEQYTRAFKIERVALFLKDGATI